MLYREGATNTDAGSYRNNLHIQILRCKYGYLSCLSLQLPKVLALFVKHAPLESGEVCYLLKIVFLRA